jgi:hypothetical protein
MSSFFALFKTWMPAKSSPKTRGACHRAALLRGPVGAFARP